MTGVLITGGTGTFGQAFVPELLHVGVIRRVVILSRDEFKQSEMERKFSGNPDFHKLRFYIGDVRDRLRLEMAMQDITHVVHAAALKRIEKCEQDPIEAIATNVIGTANVIHASLRMGSTTQNVVGLSTDKACNPINLYGATKLTMERLILAANNLSGGRARFSVVRYGNIFGSRGSVVRLWNECKANNFPITVTDPHATRFFMRVEEATDLVRRQMFLAMEPEGKTRELVYPVNMPGYRLGDLIKAMDLDTRMGTLSIAGLGPFEKRHEEMAPGISSADARRMTVDELREEVKRLNL